MAPTTCPRSIGRCTRPTQRNSSPGLHSGEFKDIRCATEPIVTHWMQALGVGRPRCPQQALCPVPGPAHDLGRTGMLVFLLSMQSYAVLFHKHVCARNACSPQHPLPCTPLSLPLTSVQRALGHDNNKTVTEGHAGQSYADRIFGIADLRRRGRSTASCAAVNKVKPSTG